MYGNKETAKQIRQQWEIEANKHYEIDILDGYGVAQSW